ncbi:MAG TPA: hypothetical protein VFE98_00375 [Candidatus Bathyarchaeia archaeon]|nr:hypothetical protein [Candidatus Bathyarchaeia archaeon]
MKYQGLIIPVVLGIIILFGLSVPAVRATGNTLYFSPNNIAAPAVPGVYISYLIYADTVGTSPSSGINGWDLVVTANDPGGAILNPVSISITGNLLTAFGTVTEIANCVNGVGRGCVTGIPGVIPKDGPGIVHTAAVGTRATPAPISGLIANITYQTVSAGPTTIRFGITTDTGCGPISGNPDPCNSLTDGSITPVPHKSLTATFGTPAAADFRISRPNGTAPAPINPGGSGTAKINFTSLTSFAGAVTITQTIYPSTGLSFSCTSPVVLIAGGSVTSTCTYTSVSPFTPGLYVVTVNATSGLTFHLAPVTVAVGDFKVATIAGTVTLQKGATGSTDVTVTSVNGFAEPINLVRSVANPDFSVDAVQAQANIGSSATSILTIDTQNQFTGTVALSDTVPAGLTCQPITLTTVTLPPRAQPTLSCSSTTGGTFNVTITGTANDAGFTIVHTATAIFTFGPAPNFNVAASSPTAVNTGDTATSTISVISLNGFTGTVQLSNTVPAGLSCRPINPSSVTVPASSTASLACTSTTLGSYAVTVTATNTTVTRTSKATFNFANILTAACPASANVPAGGVARGTCTFSGLTAGSYVVSITGNYSFTGGSILHAVSLTVKVQDFRMTPPSPLTFGAGYTTTGTVSFVSLFQFASTVTITTSANSTLITPTCPSNITLKATNDTTHPAFATCTFASTIPGAYYVNVTGTSGLTINIARINLVVTPDFTVSVGPPVSIATGATGSTTVTVNGYGFTGTISFTASPSPSGLTCNTPASITLPPTPATTSLNCSTSTAGTYNVTITATSGSLSHTKYASFSTAPDISITSVTVAPTSASVGQKVTVTVGIKYSGTSTQFTLLIKWGQITVASQNFTAQPSQTPVNYDVTWDTTGYSAGTAVISASIPPLPGEINKSDNVGTGPSFVLNPAQSPFLSGTTLIIVIGAVVAAVAAIAGLFFLKRREKPLPTPV